MQSILISIKPEYCKLIASGKKTLEIRKSIPKSQPPFKCYIYCTKGGIGKSLDNSLVIAFNDKNEAVDVTDTIGNGKVIGEFVCDQFYEYESEFCKDREALEAVSLFMKDEDGEVYTIYETSNEQNNPDTCFLCRNSRLSFEDIRNYIGFGIRKFYGWHISELKIYDKPIDLQRFQITKVFQQKTNPIVFKNPLNRPPQSWCYVDDSRIVFDRIREYWDGKIQEYNADTFGQDALKESKISEETLKKLKAIAEEE